MSYRSEVGVGVSVGSPVVGVPLNSRARGTASAFLAAAVSAGVVARAVDVATVRLRPELDGVRDCDGEVVVTHLAPGLVCGDPVAALALEWLERRGVSVLNPSLARDCADDKAATAVALAAGGVPQPRTVLVTADTLLDVEELGYPLVLKRPAGAFGLWVRRVTDRAGLLVAAEELLREGGSMLVAQAEVSESLGTAIRVIVVDGRVVASTERVAPAGEWRSNVARGAAQREVVLSDSERDVAVGATAAVSLGFAGVDVVRSAAGPLVLEVNASPGFASMGEAAVERIAASVVGALLLR